ncbi:ABC transporter ATP-binding protein [Pseudoalteromonas sp. R3]|uniref:ABC transporter ATP-binding protein n=1 Tax=Pseudoalteromonas sp. R3 TaxID=1709477 RepID=UPI0006B5EC16|nr:ABC transporter ATP-binding protein [Pseudoalteromonas sp. R3]AZZ99943.1 ABC transporter ATP-binding protein [Pseudoalteromonas sp. R3]
MIKLQQINRVFRTSEVETTALHNIDLHVEQGDFLAIMGPSGCGKSTLLSILGMLDSPTSGTYLFANQAIERYSEQQLAELRKRQLGFIFQSFNLIDDLTVAQNVELPLIYQKVAKKQRQEQVQAMLTRVNLAHRAGHLPQQLSGGQQQRVAIARALVCNPSLILADEPTGNLDSQNGEEVMQLLQQLNRDGTTIVMVTHSEQDALYGNKTVRLLDGEIISHERPAARQSVPEAVYA